MAPSKTLGWLVLAFALAACARGGKPLRGDEAIAAPATPASEASWLNGSMDLGAEHGKVILVEAFHPS